MMGSVDSGFRAIVERAAEGILLADLETRRFVHANEAICWLLGYEHEELIGLTSADIHPADELSQVVAHFESQVAGEKVLAPEVPLLRKDGDILYADVRSFKVTFDGRECLAGMFADITERIEIEKGLIHQREQVLAYLDLIEAIVIALDRKGRIVLINRAGAEILEAEEEDLVGEPWFERFLPPESAKQVRETFNQLMSDELPSVEYFENYVVTCTGKRRFIDWHNALRYEGDRVVGTLSFGMDITRHRQADQALAEVQEQYRSTFEKAAIGVVHVSPDGNFLRANTKACSILGREMEELQGLTFQEITFPEDLNIGGEYVHDVVAGKRDTAIIEKRYIRSNGSLVWVRLTAAPIRDDDGELMYMVSIMEDITERKKLDAELKDLNENLETLVEERTEEAINANRAKSEFLSSMSHELRTPLNSIIGFSGIMLDGRAGEISEEQQRQLAMIQASGKRLLSLVNDILDLSKIEAEATSIELHEANVCQICSDAVEQVRPQAEDKGIELRFTPCTEECARCSLVMVDQNKLTQILLNLLNNAVKFTKAGSAECRVDRSGEKTMFIRVTDTGVGIDKGALERIFGEFEQIPLEDEAKPQGTGLGLSISRKLAHLLGGELTAKSAPGSGSEFTLELPLRFADDPQE
ncbi:MAG: PAS domain S-box protein [Actinomycetota bacterium]|jgi:PAS domain S-box-containing protein|nr:PAS domain S-box protein [Actinomycetota bacterium]